MSIISYKMVKTRKEHRCVGCARKMPKGSNMQSVTSSNDGKILRDYWCNTCQTYWNKYMRYEDEVGYGELKSEDYEGWEEIRKKVED